MKRRGPTTVIPDLLRTGSPPQALFKGQHKAEYAWFTISDSLPDTQAKKGHDSTLAWGPSLLTTLPERAAVWNNEVL